MRSAVVGVGIYMRSCRWRSATPPPEVARQPFAKCPIPFWQGKLPFAIEARSCGRGLSTLAHGGKAGVVKLADTQDLGSCGLVPWGFKSLRPHHAGPNDSKTLTGAGAALTRVNWRCR